jgi:hypothetical protein
VKGDDEMKKVIWEVYETYENQVLATCDNGSEALKAMDELKKLYHEMGVGLFPLRARAVEVAC